MSRYTTHEQIVIDRLLDLARELLTGGYVPDHLRPPIVDFLATGCIGYYVTYKPYQEIWRGSRKCPASQFLRVLWLVASYHMGGSLDNNYVRNNEQETYIIRSLMKSADNQNTQHETTASDH